MFESINNILFEKKNELNLDGLESFSPYMVTRYLSFYSDDYVDYANETLNMYGNLLDGVDQYRYFMNIVPKLRKRKISYIKKTKPEKDESDIHAPDFYSKKDMVEMDDLLTLLNS